MYQKTTTFEIFRRVGLILLLLFAGFPVLFLILSTFKTPFEIFRFPPTFVFKPTLVNFSSLAKDWPQFFGGLKSSAIVAFFSSTLTILLAAPAGYALSRYSRKFLNASAFFMLAVRMYPPLF